MMIGIFHEGSGLGNQLHRYVATRVLALDKGIEFGMIAPQEFKGFMNLDMGKPLDVPYILETISGKITPNAPVFEVGLEYKTDIPDGIIDGEFQDERYFEHRLPEIREWLKTEPIELSDLCIINFRGGEYKGISDLYLTQEYWDKAVKYMALKYSGIRFKIVTDDIAAARVVFPMMPVSHDFENDWQSIRWAKYLIISNSSFAILPALMNENAIEIVAPEFWAGRNIGQWRYPMNKYKKFTYL